MIQACVIFYNDGPALLEACLTSLRRAGADRIVAVDGAFADFPHTSFSSTDGCLDVAGKLADEVIPAPARAWETQIEKRNAYLSLQSEKDLYLILDADEVIEGTFPRRIPKGEYLLDFSAQDFSAQYIRLLSHRAGLAYRDKHSWLYDAQGLIVNQPDFNKRAKHLAGVRIVHHNADRPQRRQQEDAVYMAKRKEPDNPSQKAPAASGAVRMLALQAYSGFDPLTSAPVNARAGQVIEVSAAKAAQLLNDFPREWEKA